MQEEGGQCGPPPKVSIVVVAYEMRRQLERTIRSLSPLMQAHVARDDYELIVVDNGSADRLGETTCRAFGARVRWLRVDDATPSPGPAANLGIAAARAPLVGVMIDGARLASPGLIHEALEAARRHPRPLVATLGLHLGREPQQQAVARGYDEAEEDRLLESVDWTEDGYRLFEISAFGRSSVGGWYAMPSESNALFLPAALWEELGGYDEGFRSPGGGLVNLDLFARACELPETQLLILLGEATFHQLHGGASTSRPASRWDEFHGEYLRLRGRSHRSPAVEPTYLGDPRPVGPESSTGSTRW